MQWYEVLVMIIGAIGGTSGILSVYTAAPKKKSIEIDNFKKMLDEAQDEREKLKNEYNAYSDKTNAKIKELEEKVVKMDSKMSNQLKAINMAYRCRFPKDIDECPVIHNLDNLSCNKCE